MKYKKSGISNTFLMVLGTFIIGSIILTIFIYNGLFFGSGSEQVSAVGISYDYLEPTTLFQKIELIEGLNDYSQGAEEILLGYSQQRNTLGYYANLKLARMYAANEIDASPYYIGALDLYKTKDINFEYANYLITVNKLDKATEIFIDLLPDKKAVDNLLDLDFTHQGIIESLFKKNQWQSVVDYYDNNLKKSDTGSSVKLKYAIALGNLGSFKDALTILETLNIDEHNNHELSWWYGRSLEGIGQVEEAKEIYQKIGESGAYRLAMLLEKEGNLKEAAQSYSESHLNVSRWKAAQLWDEMDNQEKALDLYLEIAKEEGVYQDDAAYRALIMLDKNRKIETDNLLTILEKQPSWMVRLGKDPKWTEIDQSDVDISNILQWVEDYNKIKREDLGKIELSILENNATKLEKLALGQWYMKQGNYPLAVSWGIKALRDEPCRQAYELAYPRPYANLVNKWAKEYDVDPYLVWAVMREESHFREGVFSKVGATGLMQIMPATGQDIAGRLKVTVENSDLLKPDINIQFGTYYIRSMLNMFSGDIDKALAAYNGGGGNVRRWSSSNIGNNNEGFPTSITFLETREYITKVGNSYYIYKWLYED